jgi:adenylylsulfate kinase
MDRETDFIEVFVEAPLEVCEERDPKGLYKKARAGEIPEFTGISAPYEEPVSPEITLDTSLEDVSTCVDRLIEALIERGFIPGE